MRLVDAPTFNQQHVGWADHRLDSQADGQRAKGRHQVGLSRHQGRGMSFNHSIADIVAVSDAPLLQKAPWWERVEQGAVATILNGYPWKSSYFNGKEGAPLIRIRDVTTGSTETFYNGPIEENFWIENGDLLVGMDGDFNCRLWSGGRGLLNQRVCRIAPHPAFYDKRFLMHVLPGYLAKINELTHSITVKHLSSKTLAEIPLPLPALAEQRRIAMRLDSLTWHTTRARAELDLVPALIARYKQAILSAAFDGELTKDWRSSTGAAEPRPAKLDELVAESIRNGLSVRGSDEPPGVRALRLSALRGGTVDLGDVRYLPITDDRARKFLIRKDDVLVSRGNGTKAFVGVAALVRKVDEPTIFPDTAFRIRLNPDVAGADWFALLWNAAQVRIQIERAAKTTAGIWKVSQADLAKVELRLPHLAEQREIVSRIEGAFGWLDRMETEHQHALRLLPRLNQAILGKAFRGELVAQDPNDEPAAILLERLRMTRVEAPKSRHTAEVSATGEIPVSIAGDATPIRKEQDMNKTRKDVSAEHLCDIVRRSGGAIKADALWRASEMQIDEFYKLLRDDVSAKRLRESKDKVSITNAS